VVADEPSIHTSLRNFREYDAPLATKLQLLVRNNLIKARTRKQCCGNHGQPGC
jgi:hypothetical protein